MIIYRIIRDTKTPFVQEKEDYYKPKRVNNFWNNNHIERENNGDENRVLSLDEYLNKTKPCLRDMIINLQKYDTWKIQLRAAISLVSSKHGEE